MLKSTRFSFLFFRNHISDFDIMNFKKEGFFTLRLNLNLLLDLNQFVIIYQLFITYITDSNVAIDWENSRSVSDAEMKE